MVVEIILVSCLVADVTVFFMTLKKQKVLFNLLLTAPYLIKKPVF